MRLFIISAVSVLAVAANAQIIWDNTSIDTSTTFRSAGDAPGLRIQNTNAFNVVLGRVSFEGRSHAAQNFKFFLADSGGSIISSVIQAVGATGSHTIIGTDVNWTLLAGQTYTIAAISESAAADYNYRVPDGTLQNGLLGLVNSNWSGYANPASIGNGGAEMTWRLEAVPEPATLTALGLGLAAVAARRRRNR